MARGTLKKVLVGAAIIAGGAVHALPALAETYGQPSEWGLGFQPGVTEIADDIHWMHDILLTPIIVAISLFVLALLAYVCWKFSETNNPTPSRNAHNTTLEFAWTVVPVLILMIIAVPSFRLLYKQYDFPKPDLVIKAIGHQWYWEYQYPEAGENVAFDAYMIDDADLKPGQPRLLATDNEVVVPVGKVVHVLVTANDVMHNWTMPAFGSKIDAVPGRTTATWFKARREGVYYGQCSELCGVRHAFMPITVRVVNDNQYGRWLEARKADDEDGIENVMKEIVAYQRETGKTKDVASLTAD
ncbi:MAG: cytochrome c oxidase subunit II [Pseudomonadota bacterium]